MLIWPLVAFALVSDVVAAADVVVVDADVVVVAAAVVGAVVGVHTWRTLLLAVVALRLCLRWYLYCLRYLFFPLCMFTKHLINFEFFDKVWFSCI